MGKISLPSRKFLIWKWVKGRVNRSKPIHYLERLKRLYIDLKEANDVSPKYRVKHVK